jgi:cation transport protein ChaC
MPPSASSIAAATSHFEQTVIDRQGLANGSALADYRKNVPPGTVFPSDEELARGLDAALASYMPGTDLYVFGYGSLMWNPAMEFTDVTAATIRGWCRRFCIWMHQGRGTVDTPGLMLGLEPGGMCRGLVYRLSGEMAASELRILWVREMLSGVYRARWVAAKTLDGKTVSALTFVTNHKHPTYVRNLSSHEVAQTLATARGYLGTNLAYFRALIHVLRQCNISDRGMARVEASIEAFGSKHCQAADASALSDTS